MVYILALYTVAIVFGLADWENTVMEV